MNNLNKMVNIFLGLSFLGLIDSIYLSYMKLQESDLVCNVLEGCNLVTQSEYAKIFGIPLAYLGVFFYCLLILTLLFFLKSKKAICFRFLQITIFAGFLSSLYFLYLQVFVIRALCTYCLFSLIINLIFFIYMFFFEYKKRAVLKNTAL